MPNRFPPSLAPFYFSPDINPNHHCSPPPLQVTLAVNKCENAAKADLQAADFWGLGLEPIAVSAISGSGTGELLDHLIEHMKPADDAEEVEPNSAVVSVAIVGRPNVGKSSLVNAITGARADLLSVAASVVNLCKPVYL